MIFNQEQAKPPVPSRFRFFYKQPLLKGELGLTAHDLARALKRRLYTVKRKLESPAFLEKAKSLNYKVAPVGAINNITGLEVSGYVLDIPATLLFLLEFDCAERVPLFDFLFRGIERAMSIQSEDQVQSSKSAKRVLNSQKTHYVITEVRRQINLFGEVEETIRRCRVPREDMSPIQILEAQIQHRLNTIHGLVRNQKKG